MNAANPKQSSPADAGPRSFEPSMEEILASIRRIISDDGSAARPTPAAPSFTPAPQPSPYQQPPFFTHPSPFTQPGSGVVDFKPAVDETRSVLAPRPGQGDRIEPDVRSMFSSASWTTPVESVPVSDISPVVSRPESASALDQEHISAAERAADFVVERAIARFGARSDEAASAPVSAPFNSNESSAPAPSQPQPLSLVANSTTAPVEPVQAMGGVDTAGQVGQAPERRPSADLSEAGPAPQVVAPEAKPDLSQQVAASALDLFSAGTIETVSSAFNVLAAARLAGQSHELMDMARDLMRPLLKNWLDENLPNMVERMVRAEIERVARGGR